MSDLRLDDCSHCACTTHLFGWNLNKAVSALESGKLGCDNCCDHDEDDHIACVVLYDENDAVLWDGRCKRGRLPHAEGDVG